MNSWLYLNFWFWFWLVTFVYSCVIAHLYDRTRRKRLPMIKLSESAICPCSGDWGKWGSVKHEDDHYKNVLYYYQERTCASCGLTARREVKRSAIK